VHGLGAGCKNDFRLLALCGAAGGVWASGEDLTLGTGYGSLP
jgi:hypothetical protein